MDTIMTVLCNTSIYIHFMWLHSKMTPLHVATLMATLLTGFHQFGHTNSSKRSALVVTVAHTYSA